MKTIFLKVENQKQVNKILNVLENAEIHGIIDFPFNCETSPQKIKFSDLPRSIQHDIKKTKEWAKSIHDLVVDLSDDEQADNWEIERHAYSIMKRLYKYK